MSSEESVLPNNDDCFTYKILKRRRLFHPSADAQPPATAAKAEDNRRRQRKKTTLSKLKSGYQKELDQWGLLSNSLRSLRNRADQRLELRNQAEAKEAIVHDVSCLCDVAESVGNTQQEQLAESFFNLAIWSSPHELMASLCFE